MVDLTVGALVDLVGLNVKETVGTVLGSRLALGFQVGILVGFTEGRAG